MDSSKRVAVAGLILCLAVGGFAVAQNSPRIGYVCPAGGQAGDTFQVVVGGQYLDAAGRAFFSGHGVQAVTVGHVKPLTQKEFNELREQAGQLQERKAAATKGTQGDAPASLEWTAEDERMLAEIRKTLAERAPNRQANPAISETVTLSITLSPDAQPGVREMRFMTAVGLSSPLVFHVGRLPEVVENEPKDEAAGGARTGVRPGKIGQTEMRVSLPAVLNGQILPGDVDRYRFSAGKGQKLVVAACARELIPYLADAVPGWFQAVLTLYDAEGREVAYTDDYRFSPDPVLFYEIPAEGEYVVEIRDAIYRGREDFVYRITIGELPFVTSIFPLGGTAGQRTRVDLTGWNLPASRIAHKSGHSDGRSEIVDLADRPPSLLNRPSFAIDTLPECLEKESNDSPGEAQQIAFPLIVNGRIDKSGDNDVFCFEGRAGSEVVAEVTARRLGSPLDSVLKLTNAIGRPLAINDDQEDKGQGLATHHADSLLHVTLPADGTYYLHLADAQNKGGAEYGYRLRVSPPRPDFELRIVPSSVNLRGGTTIPLTVYALRKDGFTGDISLVLKDAPSGFSLSGWVPSGPDKVQVTLTAPATPTSEPIALSLEGRATIEGREVVRPVVPADDIMQAFFYRHLVPAKELRVAVSDQRMARGTVTILDDVPIRIPAGGAATVRVAAPSRSLAGAMQLEVGDPPEGIIVAKVTSSRDVAEILLRCDAEKVKPGLKGNLIIGAFTSRPAAGKDKAPANRPRAPAATLPAIPFEIVSP